MLTKQSTKRNIKAVSHMLDAPLYKVRRVRNNLPANLHLWELTTLARGIIITNREIYAQSHTVL